MNNKEDVLLKVMENEGDLELLYGLWTLAQNAPTRCAEVLMSYKDVARGCAMAVESLGCVAEQMEKVRERGGEIELMLQQVRAWKEEIKTIDEDVFLNRMNRLCDLAERIEKVRRSGSLNTLRVILEEKSTDG